MLVALTEEPKGGEVRIEGSAWGVGRERDHPAEGGSDVKKEV